MNRHRVFVPILVLSLSAPVAAAEWTLPEIRLPEPLQHPVVACTPGELSRLQAAFHSDGPRQHVVAEVVAEAERLLDQPLAFPPRGGQHNQWYQCDVCQIGLQTVDDQHHRCPRCDKVYTGAPYDDVIFARQHRANLHRAVQTAWAYAITGEERFARAAAAVLGGYAERYTKYPYHTSARLPIGNSGGHLFEQTLNEANHLAEHIAPAFDLIYDAPCLSDAERTLIAQGLIRPMLKNIDKHKAGKGNWQTWHNAGMLAGGAVLGDIEWVRKAIAAPRNGFEYQMQVSVSPDGMWYENSWGYHFYTLGALVRIVEVARRLEIDLWSHPALKKMFTTPVQYAMPDGSLPRFGDDVRTRVQTAGEYLEYAWHAYRDPALLPYLPNPPTWNSVLLGRESERRPERPALGSQLFPDAGHAILRSGDPAGMAAVLTFGPYGGFHGHFDKLSFVWFGYGRELGVDPGRAASQAYRLPVHTRWYKATLGHNTVLVDRQSQRPAAGELESFGTGQGDGSQLAIPHVVARCRDAYPGVQQRRLLCLLPAYLLVADVLTSDESHQYDWVFHHRGQDVHCLAADQDADFNQAFPGAEYLARTKTGVAEGPVAVQFVAPPITTHLHLAGDGATSVIVGDGVGQSVLDRVPLVMLGRRATSVCFAAVLEPVPEGRTPTVTAVFQDTSDDQTRITVRRGDCEDRVTLAADGTVSVASDEQ